MALSRRKIDRIAASVFVALCVGVAALAIYALSPLFRGAFTSAGDIRVAQPEQAVRDARALIADRRINREKYDAGLLPESLPPSLRVPKLRFAIVHDDHVDLVLARNPDWNVGARIWSVKHRPHRDQPTPYRDVYYFDATNDLPESPDNIR